MRQLARGVLATLVLAMAACGSDGGPTGAPNGDGDRPVDEVALAASSKISTPPEVVPGAASLTIAVTSPEGIDSVGLDATASVLLGRPDTEVVVIAPATDVRIHIDARAAGAVAPVSAETMTGHAASAVNGTLLDVVDVLTTAETDLPDLLVIGLADAAPDSAAMAGARLAMERGLPVLIVDVDGADPDLAAAGLLLSMVTDYELDAIVEAAAVHVLTVPACTDGTIRGPVVVDSSPPDAAYGTVDCTSPDTGPFDDESSAWAAGHATLALRSGN